MVSRVAIVLDRQAAGENLVRLALLTREEGALPAWLRTSSRPSSPSPPDLFETVAAELKPASAPGWFIHDLRRLSGHPSLALNYEAFTLASRWARLLANNPSPTHDSPGTFDLTAQALSAFARGTRPDLTYLKATWRLARDAGYPVREEWAPSLPHPLQSSLAPALQEPLDTASTTPSTTQTLTSSLESYLHHTHDFRLPP